MSSLRTTSNYTEQTCGLSSETYQDDPNRVCETYSRIQKGTLKIKPSKVWDKELFTLLLDDMDNISESSTDSLHKRTKIRDIFSEWLFNHDMIECADETEFIYMGENDDVDSAYDTAESNSLGQDKTSRSMCRDELCRKIYDFNENLYGLSICMDKIGLGYSGQIRIHLNLYRPVKMAFHLKNTILNDTESEDNSEMCTVKASAFQIPQNSSQVIHIKSTTNTSEAVGEFLEKFSIVDSPCKFSLYESVDKGEGHGKDMILDIFFTITGNIQLQYDG